MAEAPTKPDPQLVALVESNALSREQLSDLLQAQTAALLRPFRGWYNAGAVQELSAQIAQLVAATQQLAASQEDTYLTQLFQLVAGRLVAPVGPVKTVELRRGAHPAQVYERLAEQYRWEISRGTASPKALGDVLTRAAVMNDTDTTLAARGQWDRFFTAHKVTAYRRVVHPELSKGGSCGLCVAASDRVYSANRLMPIHDRCHCGVMPIIGDFDAGNSLNGYDLGQLYDDAGSTNRRGLKRMRYSIHEHGELGPVLTKHGDSFRGPAQVRADRAA